MLTDHELELYTQAELLKRGGWFQPVETLNVSMDEKDSQDDSANETEFFCGFAHTPTQPPSSTKDNTQFYHDLGMKLFDLLTWGLGTLAFMLIVVEFCVWLFR